MSDAVRQVRRRHRSGRSRRIRRGMACVALIAVLLSGWAVLHRFGPASSWFANHNSSAWEQGNASRNLAMLAARQAWPASASGSRRLVYPFSLIPGGVRSPEELEQISEHDPAVSEHFSGFDFRNAKVIQVDEPRLVYLSYRMKGKIFWTKKKFRLHKGEKLITDGKIAARTRCANRVSESAQNAVSPEEPPAEKFEEPMASGGNATQIAFPGNFQSALLTRPELSGFGPEGPPGMPGSGSLFGPGGGGGLPPIFPPPIPGGGCNPAKENCSPPPPAVPEPGTILLMSSGLAGIYLRYRKSKK